MLRIVLIKPSHPGNIGATARAMKVMGLSELYLVAPKHFPDAIATARAAGGVDILEKAVVVDSLLDAIADCELVYGSGADIRDSQRPVLTPKTALEQLTHVAPTAAVAVVFGTERSGMSNEELQFCHGQIQIPTSAGYSSLNLAAAVQIICYEYQLASQTATSQHNKTTITVGKREALYQMIETLALASNYLSEQAKKQFPDRIRQLLNQLSLTDQEADLLFGFCKALLHTIKFNNT